MADRGQRQQQSVPWRATANIPRYCDVDMPDMAHLPGVNTRQEDFTVTIDTAFVFGVDLYNHAYWFEAHDAWEALWRELSPQSLERSGLKLLITAANLNLKIELGKPNAALRLSNALLDETGEWRTRGGKSVFGVALLVWFKKYETYISDVFLRGSIHHEPGRFPFLTILNDR